MRPRNVLHLRDTHEVGGPGKTILETHRAIDPALFRLRLAVFVRRGEPVETPFVRAAREYGMPVHVVSGFNQYDPLLVWRIAQLVRRLGVDIVHAHEVKSDVIAYLTARLRRVSIVTTLHGWIGNDVKQRCLVALDKRVVGRFDRVIAVSDQIRREAIAAGVSADKVRLLHNAIVVERYRSRGERGHLARALGRPLCAPVIASIGRLSAEKGHMDLVEAMRLVAERGLRATVVLIGDGPERSRLRERVSAAGLESMVFLPGYLTAPERLLEDVDLMVLPSHTEGLPNAALEALAMEVPVLATAVGGTPEVVTDGATGRLVPPQAPQALAEAIGEFLAEPGRWQAMARRGRQMVEERFDFRARTRRLEAIYSELADRSDA